MYSQALTFWNWPADPVGSSCEMTSALNVTDWLESSRLSGTTVVMSGDADAAMRNGRVCCGVWNWGVSVMTHPIAGTASSPSASTVAGDGGRGEGPFIVEGRSVARARQKASPPAQAGG